MFDFDTINENELPLEIVVKRMIEISQEITWVRKDREEIYEELLMHIRTNGLKREEFGIVMDLLKRR